MVESTQTILRECSLHIQNNTWPFWVLLSYFVLFFKTRSHVAQGDQEFSIARGGLDALIPCATMPSLCSAGVQTRGFTHARQAWYQVSHTLSPNA